VTSADVFRLLESAHVGAYAVSLDQTIVSWNQAAQRILGFSPGQVLGRRCYDVLAGLTGGAMVPGCLQGCPSMRALKAGEVPGAVDVRMLCASGERREVSVTPMVVAGRGNDAPVLVHVIHERSGSGSPEQATDSVREGLVRRGADVVSDHPAVASDSARGSELTGRELEVLRLVALGRSTPEIAKELAISSHTVLNHIRNFRRKLEATTKLDAVVTAIRLGLLDWS
jgi:DNA-binding CsgD family transcriptional regulator